VTVETDVAPAPYAGPREAYYGASNPGQAAAMIGNMSPAERLAMICESRPSSPMCRGGFGTLMENVQTNPSCPSGQEMGPKGCHNPMKTVAEFIGASCAVTAGAVAAAVAAPHVATGIVSEVVGYAEAFGGGLMPVLAGAGRWVANLVYELNGGPPLGLNLGFPPIARAGDVASHATATPSGAPIGAVLGRAAEEAAQEALAHRGSRYAPSSFEAAMKAWAEGRATPQQEGASTLLLIGAQGEKWVIRTDGTLLHIAEDGVETKGRWCAK
jgi:hypothetical protein